LAVGAVLACLPAAAAWATLSAAAAAVVRPIALDYAEPVVYGQAMRILAGEPLYQPIDRLPLTVAAYTPMYYWVVAALQALFGPGFGPGRLLSLFCGVAAASLVGVLAGRRAGGIWVGAFAGLLFLALGFPRDRDDAPWMGLYRVDMLGVALSVAAICVLSWRSSKAALVSAGALAGAALLCKQTLAAALLAGALWLVLDRRKATFPSSVLLFVGSAVFTLAVPCLALEATTGAFFENTIEANVNPFYLVVAGGLLSVLLRTQWLPLVLVGAYLAWGRPWQANHSRLLLLYWATSGLSLLGLGKIGANYNYWIEFAAATSILAARGAACLVNLSNPRHAVLTAIAAIVLVGSQLGGPPGVLASARAAQSATRSLTTSAPDPAFDRLVARVRDEPRMVLAEPMDVLVLAGRQVSFEPFIFSVRLDMGRWRPDDVIARICTGQVGLLVLGYTLEVGARMTDGLHAFWPPPVMSALSKSMALEQVTASRYIYTPRPDPDPTCRG
jgi:hypothetical protein